MIADSMLALIGALVLLHLASGQFQPRGFPPIHRDHGIPHPNAPIPPYHRGLRQAKKTKGNGGSTSGTPSTGEAIKPPNIDCGESPLVKPETGCPCFNAATIAAVMDVETQAEYCSFYASKPVDENDQCSHLLPPAYASFSASTPYSDTGSFSMNFGVSSHYDTGMQGGTCSGSVYYYKSTYDETGETANSVNESHGYDFTLEVTKAQLKDCLEALNEVKAGLPEDKCYIEVGGY